jgi:hypothetical protein
MRKNTEILVWLLVLSLGLAVVIQASRESARIKSQRGVEVLVAGVWHPVQCDMESGAIFVPQGATLRTSSNSTADVILFDSKSSLRLMPGTVLAFKETTLEELQTEEAVSTTRLELLGGAVVGVQSKLTRLSAFDFVLPSGVVHIVGTEYYVSTSGAVSVISGTVTVRFNLPGNGGSVVVTVAAGQSFDPATGKVVSTTPEFVQSIQADVETARNNAQVFKAGGATIVVKPELSPVHP